VHITLDVVVEPGFEDPEDTMARKMLYRIYPLVMASALGYLIGLLAIKGL
jgi:hypothetical protein